MKANIAAIRELADEHGLTDYPAPGYSGRGMCGAKASIAVEGPVYPGSPAGKALIAAGCAWDSMGLDWIYYTKD